MKLDLVKSDRRLVAKMSGELDHHCAASVRKKLDDALEDRKIVELEIDMSKLSFMDSSGIGVIIGRYKTLIGRGGRVSVRGVNSQIDRILRISGMYKILRKA